MMAVQTTTSDVGKTNFFDLFFKCPDDTRRHVYQFLEGRSLIVLSQVNKLLQKETGQWLIWNQVLKVEFKKRLSLNGKTAKHSVQYYIQHYKNEFVKNNFDELVCELEQQNFPWSVEALDGCSLGEKTRAIFVGGFSYEFGGGTPLVVIFDGHNMSHTIFNPGSARRYGHSVTAISEDSCIALGGLRYSGYQGFWNSAVAYTFDHNQSTLSEELIMGAHLPEIAYHTAEFVKTSQGDYIVAFGGVKENTGSCNDTHIYDLNNKNWRKLDTSRTLNVPLDRAGHCSVSIGTKLYIFGGHTCDRPYPRAGAAVNDAWCLDCETWTWSSLNFDNADFRSCPTFGARCLAVNGHNVILLGGQFENNTHRNFATRINLKKLEVTQVNCPLPMDRQTHGAVELNDRYVVFGGFSNSHHVQESQLMALKPQIMEDLENEFESEELVEEEFESEELYGDYEMQPAILYQAFIQRLLQQNI